MNPTARRKARARERERERQRETENGRERREPETDSLRQRKRERERVASAVPIGRGRDAGVRDRKRGEREAVELFLITPFLPQLLRSSLQSQFSQTRLPRRQQNQGTHTQSYPLLSSAWSLVFLFRFLLLSPLRLLLLLPVSYLSCYSLSRL